MSEEKECAGNEEKEYDNTDCLRKLGEAFADIAEGTNELNYSRQNGFTNFL